MPSRARRGARPAGRDCQGAGRNRSLARVSGQPVTPSPSMGIKQPSPSMGEGSGGGDAEDRSMVKKAPSAGAGERSRNLRRDMTKAEQRLWQMLRSQQTEGHRFRRQVPIGGFIADFVCLAARLIVEINGGQHDPSSEAEARRTFFLESERYRVLRFWNNEVLDNPEGVRAIIAEALHQGSSSPTRPVTPTRMDPLTPTHTLPHHGGGPEATLENPAGSEQLIA